MKSITEKQFQYIRLLDGKLHSRYLSESEMKMHLDRINVRNRNDASKHIKKLIGGLKNKYPVRKRMAGCTKGAIAAWLDRHIGSKYDFDPWLESDMYGDENDYF